MRGRATRSAIAASSAVLAVLGIAGCNQSKPNENSSQSDLKIVEQVQIDQNGAEVKPEAGTTPADPAGDGKAACPPVSIAMAGALNGPDAALGIIPSTRRHGPPCRIQDDRGHQDLPRRIQAQVKASP